MNARTAKVIKDDIVTESEQNSNPEALEKEQLQTLHQDDPEMSFDRDARIAELAYYKAEQRGFEPGYELDDWYAAEQEINISQR